MAFDAIIGDKKFKLVQITAKKPAAKKAKGVGCDNCPTNDAKGVHKIFTKIKGRKILIFGLTPEREDNKREEAFVGKSSQFLWNELKRVGISSKDCDIQYIVRCMACTNEGGTLVGRAPSKEELKCCSIYTEQAIQKAEAKIYILLGAVAAKQVLGKEYNAATKVFWSERLKAKVYCLYHPNYFLRPVNTQAALKEFQSSLAKIAEDFGSKGVLSQYGYLEQQDYKEIVTVKDAKKEVALIKRICREKKIRVSVDLEDDKDDVTGKKYALCIGMCIKPGRSRVFIIDHPKARKVDGTWQPLKRKVRDRIVKCVKSIIEDPTIEKVMHHGSYDAPAVEKEIDTKFRGFKFDTNYSTFLANPESMSYGLKALTPRYCPEFGNYKTIIVPECIPQSYFEENAELIKLSAARLYDTVAKRGVMRLSLLPLRKLVLYNGGDCDVTKRLELATKNKVNLTLLEMYTNVGFVLDDMVPNGPVFDYAHYKRLKIIFPPKKARLLKQIRKAAGDPTFNPGSPQQVAELIYDKLKLGGNDSESKSTAKGIMERFALKNDVAKWIMEYRKVAKIISTYMTSYRDCAKANGGRLRTKWWLTGTRTGRLSSGGGKGKKEDTTKVINLQNVINDSLLQNLCVPDKNWDKLYAAINSLIFSTVKNYGIKDLERLYLKALDNPKKQDKYKSEIQVILDDICSKCKTSKFKKRIKRLVKKFGNIRVALGFDEGQIEVRVAAQASGDEHLIADCKKGDIHSQVGHTLSGWAVEKIKKDKKTRTYTKNVHFGILFGLAKEGLYKFLKAKDPDMTMTEEEVGRAYDRYFKRYWKMKKFIQKQRAFAEANGYVANMFGFIRKLHIPDVSKDEMGESSKGGAFWGNQSVNTVIQGAAHHLMLFALSQLKIAPKKIKKAILGVPGMEVHDALYFWVKLRDLVAAYEAGIYLLTKVPLQVIKKKYPKIKWLVPLEVDARVGFRLGDMIEYDEKLSGEELLVSMYFETLKSEAKLNAEIKFAKRVA